MYKFLRYSMQIYFIYLHTQLIKTTRWYNLRTNKNRKLHWNMRQNNYAIIKTKITFKHAHNNLRPYKNRV